MGAQSPIPFDLEKINFCDHFAPEVAEPFPTDFDIIVCPPSFCLDNRTPEELERASLALCLRVLPAVLRKGLQRVIHQSGTGASERAFPGTKRKRCACCEMMDSFEIALKSESSISLYFLAVWPWANHTTSLSSCFISLCSRDVKKSTVLDQVPWERL